MKSFFQRFKANSTPVCKIERIVCKIERIGDEFNFLGGSTNLKIKVMDYGSNQATTSSRC